MNRLFYIFCTLIIAVTLIFVISNNEPNNIQNIEPSVDQPLSIDIKNNDLKKVVAVVESKKSINTDNIKAPVVTSSLKVSDTCILNFGKIMTTGCDKYQNIDKMNLSSFSNLSIHNNPRLIVENGKKIKSYSEKNSVFELGLSDQGAVFQMVFFAEENDQQESDLFLGAPINYESIIFLESEYTVSFDEKDQNKYLVEFTDNVVISGYLENEFFQRCINNAMYDFYIEHKLPVDEFMPCDQLTVWTDEIDYFELNDPVIKQCVFGSNSPKPLIVDPEKITSVICQSLAGADVEVMKKFTNVTYFEVTQVGNDLTYLSYFQNLLYLNLEGAGAFDFKVISNLSRLKSLIIKNSKTINISYLEYSTMQLHVLNFTNSIIGDLTFLQNQYELQVVDLSEAGLPVMPNLGANDKLVTLILRGNKLTTTEGLERFINLVELDVAWNQIITMSNLDSNNGIFKRITALGNPINCDDPKLVYSKTVKSRCNLALKYK